MRAPAPSPDDTPSVAMPRSSPRAQYHPRSGTFHSDGARTASNRLRALAALSGSLTDALAPADAAELIETKALSALGAASAVVVTFGAFPPSTGRPPSAPVTPPSLILIHAIGVPSEVSVALATLPLDAPAPLAEVARTGDALFLQSEEELRRYPEWGAAMSRAGARAAAIVPVWANGELRGVLSLTWDEPRIFDEDERAFVVTLGVMCAQAILRSHLRAKELRARDDAEHANRSKAHFLATISHELRTPINAVLGYTQLLSEEIYGAVSALQKDHLGRVRASGNHLLELVEELLSYARIEAGEEIVHPEQVMVASVVAQSLVLVRPIAEKKGLHIRVEKYAVTQEIFTDPRKLRQILVNLLANAVKYTEHGEIVLTLHAASAFDAPHAGVQLEITDSGRGIAEADHEHIFDAFWQEDQGITHNNGSTGLGLSVARQLARLLGGDVMLAHSKTGVGSTFVISMPARYVAPHAS